MKVFWERFFLFFQHRYFVINPLGAFSECQKLAILTVSRQLYHAFQISSIWNISSNMETKSADHRAMSAELEPVRLRVIFINIEISCPCAHTVLFEVLHMSSIASLETRSVWSASYHCRKADRRYIAHFDITSAYRDHVIFFHNM